MKSISVSIAIILAFVLIGCSSSGRVFQTEPGQRTATFTGQVTRTVSTRYLLYLPKDYGTAKKKWPLVMFLHGAGERGTDINLVKKHGPPKLAEQQGFEFIVVSPQCPEFQFWDVDVLNALLDEIVENYDVDESRIYLTGLSMGGYATWEFGMRHPKRFAALAPICGGGDTTRACSLKGIPTWVFHGEKDNVVPIARSEEMVSVLKRCGGDVQFTVYPTAGHDSWTETYANPVFYTWLLQQRRPK